MVEAEVVYRWRSLFDGKMEMFPIRFSVLKVCVSLFVFLYGIRLCVAFLLLCESQTHSLSVISGPAVS